MPCTDQVGHNGRDNGIVQQFATLFHVAAVDIQNVVASDDIALFVHAQATVSVTVIGKTNIQTLFHHKLLQALNMGGACIVIDVQAVRLVIDHIGVCTQCIKDGFCNVPGTTIGTVQTDFDTLEGIDAQRDQITHVTIATCNIVHSATDMLTMRKRQFRPVLVKYMELAIDVVLYQQQGFPPAFSRHSSRSA